MKRFEVGKLYTIKEEHKDIRDLFQILVLKEIKCEKSNCTEKENCGYKYVIMGNNGGKAGSYGGIQPTECGNLLNAIFENK